MYIQNLLWLEVKATGIRHTYFTKKDSKEKRKREKKTENAWRCEKTKKTKEKKLKIFSAQDHSECYVWVCVAWKIKNSTETHSSSLDDVIQINLYENIKENN